MADEEKPLPQQPETRHGDLIIPPTMVVSGKSERTEAEYREPKRSGWKSYLFLTLVTFLVFSPILKTNFFWSEYDEVERTPFLAMDDWTEAWHSETIRQHDPITLTSYFAESTIPLPAATTYRLINLLLHLSAALFLLKILEALKLRGAFAATLIFALHPATMQALFWPGYRDEIIGLVFILSSLYYGTRNQNSIDFTLSLTLGVIGSLIHPAAFALPGLLALVIYFQNKRFHLHHYNKVLPITCCLLFTYAWTRSGPSTSMRPEDLDLLTLIGQNQFFFLKQSIFPLDLKLFHPFTEGQSYNVGTLNSLIAFFIFVPLYTLAAFNLRKRWARGIILGISSFLLLLLYGNTHTGRFIDGSLAKEEHALYVALPAIIALTFCSAAGFFARKRTFGSFLWPILFGSFLLVQIGVTASYSYSLSDPVRMWKTISEEWEGSWQPKAALVASVRATGSDLLNESEMIRTLEEILEANPELHQERIYLARSYREAGQLTNATREYRQILRETEPSNEFLEEAATLLDKEGLTWEANKARERITKN